MSAAPEWSNLLGGHDDNGEYEHDPDFEFDAPQWVDIASDGQDVARYTFSIGVFFLNFAQTVMPISQAGFRCVVPTRSYQP